MLDPEALTNHEPVRRPLGRVALGEAHQVARPLAQRSGQCYEVLADQAGVPDSGHPVPPYLRWVSPLSRAAKISTIPRANSWNCEPAFPGTASRMPAFSHTMSSVARTTPATRPIPPVIATPPRTAIVIAGSAIPLPATPASGRAEANWATVTTATRPEMSPEARYAANRVRRTSMPVQSAATSLVPMA